MCMEVAGDCLPNVVVSLSTLLIQLHHSWYCHNASCLPRQHKIALLTDALPTVCFQYSMKQHCFLMAVSAGKVIVAHA